MALAAEKRRRFQAAALLVLLPCGVWLGWDVFRPSRDTNRQNGKSPSAAVGGSPRAAPQTSPAAAAEASPIDSESVGWLEHEADHTDPKRCEAALFELARRIRAGALSDAQVESIVRRALDYQADRSRPWRFGWGRVVEDAQDCGRLPQAQWDRYVHQAYIVRIRCRPKVRRGDPLVVAAELQPARSATQRSPWAGWLAPITVAGRQIEPKLGRTRCTEKPGSPILSSGMELGFLFRDTVFAYALDSATLARVPDGPQEVVVASEPMALPLGRQPVDLRAAETLRWTLLPANQPSVTVNPAPELRAPIERALSADVSCSGDSKYLRVAINSTGAPMGLASQVFIRAGGPGTPERFVDSIDLPAGERGISSAEGSWSGAPPDQVDVVLRPDPKRAARTVDLLEIWGGEIVLHGVPVRPY